MPTRRKFLLFFLVILTLLGCKFTQQVLDPALPTFPAVGTFGPLPTHTRSSAATVVLPTLPSFPPPPTETVTPTPVDTPRPSPAATLLPPGLHAPGAVYAQDFSAEVEDWAAGRDEDDYVYAERDFSDGMYRWQLQAKQDFFTLRRSTSVSNLPIPFFQLSARMIVAEAPAGIAYGLVFNLDDDDYYYFKVTQSGEYALYLHQKAGFEALISETETADVQRGASATNWLAVITRGDLLELYINGRLQDSLIDTTLRGGGIGLAVELPAGEDATIYFDDVVVCETRCE